MNGTVRESRSRSSAADGAADAGSDPDSSDSASGLSTQKLPRTDLLQAVDAYAIGSNLFESDPVTPWRSS